MPSVLPDRATGIRFRKTLASFLQDRNQQLVWQTLLIIMLGLAGLMLTSLESRIGLDWLFKLRGPRKPPDQVAIVKIDRQSSLALNLPNQPRKWPRSLHGRLVDQLSANGARAIGFDIIFADPQPPGEDAAFAAAMRRNRNVVLFSYLESVNLPGLHMEHHRAPLSILKEAALATAPFTLPKVPEHIRQAWLFRPGAGDKATLPVVLLTKLLAPVMADFNALLRNALPGDPTLAPPSPEWADEYPDQAAIAYRRLFRTHPRLATAARRHLSELDPARRSAIQSLIFTFSVGDNLVLDFYGPPQTIRSIPYADVLAGTAIDVRDKAVLVGFSEKLQPEQKDSFYTVFTTRAGLDISGMEIAASTLGNLLESRSVTPLSQVMQVALIGAFGLLLIALFNWRPGYSTIPLALIVAALYLALAEWLFARFAYWLPVTTPLLIQIPGALLLTSVAHFRRAARQRNRLHAMFRRYVPTEVADAAMGREPAASVANRRKTYAACLITDVTGFTRLSEQLSPEVLHETLNRYFQLLVPTVYEQEGHVIDVIGDALLAIWHSRSPARLRQQALMAACGILNNLQNTPADALPTRFGLHCGEVSLGNVGHGQHIEYRAVGDAINTTSRIEQLNKLLGSRILASEEILDGAPQIPKRYVGKFRLRGKNHSIRIFELLVPAEPRFTHALELFAKGNFLESAAIFQVIVNETQDTVADFYLTQCSLLADKRVKLWHDGGIIVN